eukprot:COSAG01_NODE_17_length_39991_cov_30.596160_1_plen_51_part_00
MLEGNNTTVTTMVLLSVGSASVNQFVRQRCNRPEKLTCTARKRVESPTRY